MILASFFEGKKNGFYVDIGAYHPKRYSNTHHFYIRGWRGINVDPTPGSMRAFRRRARKTSTLKLPCRIELRRSNFMFSMSRL